jgi:hypothetical protein
MAHLAYTDALRALVGALRTGSADGSLNVVTPGILSCPPFSPMLRLSLPYLLEVSPVESSQVVPTGDAA